MGTRVDSDQIDQIISHFRVVREKLSSTRDEVVRLEVELEAEPLKTAVSQAFFSIEMLLEDVARHLRWAKSFAFTTEPNPQRKSRLRGSDRRRRKRGGA